MRSVALSAVVLCQSHVSSILPVVLHNSSSHPSLKTPPAYSSTLSISFQSAFVASSLIYGEGLTPSSWQHKVRMTLLSLWFLRPYERTRLNKSNGKRSAVHWLARTRSSCRSFVVKWRQNPPDCPLLLYCSSCLIRAEGAGHSPEAVVETLSGGARASRIAMADLRPCQCKDAPRMSTGQGLIGKQQTTNRTM